MTKVDHVYGLDDVSATLLSRPAARCKCSAKHRLRNASAKPLIMRSRPCHPLAAACPNLLSSGSELPRRRARCSRRSTPALPTAPSKSSGSGLANLALLPPTPAAFRTRHGRCSKVSTSSFWDCLRHTRHPTHFSLEEALAFAARTKAKRTILTHLSHELPQEATTAILPPGVEACLYGLEVR